MTLPALYAILDVDLTLSRGLVPLDVVDAWLDAGVRLLQVRAKGGSWSGGPLLQLVEEVVRRGKSANATVIVNDRADVARLAEAGGVHLGQDDLRPSEVRGLLSPSQIIGFSTHSDAQVEAALREPIEYLAAGPVFHSGTRMAIDTPIGEAGVVSAVRRAGTAGLPVVAIGGITAENAARVRAWGAASVAVIAGLLGDDPGAQARRLLAALTSPL